MITVLFTCDKCGLKDIPVQVPARDDATVDGVVPWVRKVVGCAVGAEHDRLSPNCKTTVLTNVKIPTPKESEFIGQQIE